LVVSLTLAGCASWPGRKTTEIETRISDQCTDISDVVKKNYKLGSTWSALLARFGFNYERYGVVLSSEATERLIELDTLCRAYATGQISSDTWAKLQEAYVLSSVHDAKDNAAPEAQKQLKQNIETLQQLVKHLAESKGDPAPSPKSTQEILDLAAKETSTKLDELKKGLSSSLVAGNAQLQQEMIATNTKLDGLQSLLATVLIKQTPPLPTPRLAAPTWSVLPSFLVGFGYKTSDLTEPAKAMLRARLEGVKDSLDYRVDLAGFADSSGSPLANSRLSQARAEEVRDFLVNELMLDPAKVLSAGHARPPSRLGPGTGSRVVEVRTQIYAAPTKVASP
jgi:outer membrane protein OmpA-like peptidoglycan-associated protein